MRIGHDYLLVERGQPAETSIARTRDEFVRDNAYQNAGELTSREVFLRSSRYFARWVREAHEVYEAILRDAGRILSIGSGVGEHDVLLHLSGIDVISTDLLPGVSSPTQLLFPEMRFGTLDALDENAYGFFDFDSILVTGLDYALDEQTLHRFFDICRRSLSRSSTAAPRLVFTIRYRDNLLTRLIDDIVLPLEAHIRCRVTGSKYRVVRKQHGYRRSIRQVLRIAHEHGFAARSIRYAGFGVEYERSAIFRRLPGFLWVARHFDRLLHIGCNCAILELSPA